MMPRKIYLVRHGQSLANLDHVIHETTPDHEVILSPLGMKQATAVGKKLRALVGGGDVAVYLSPFQRARQTWRCIKQSISVSSTYSVKEDPRLREQEWGHLRSLKDIKRAEKERDAYGTFYYRLPDGESGADVYDRCTGFLATLYRDFEKRDFPPDVIIVAHGLLIRILLMRWLHWSPEYFETLRNPRNCEIFTMTLRSNGHYALDEEFPKKDEGSKRKRPR